MKSQFPAPKGKSYYSLYHFNCFIDFIPTDFGKYVGHVVKVGVPVAKAGGKPEKKKRWRTWSSGVPPRPPRFRDTMLSKPAEAKDDKVPRPGHQEYQTIDGVAFPSGTGRRESVIFRHFLFLK